jgi:hypothetical protein
MAGRLATEATLDDAAMQGFGAGFGARFCDPAIRATMLTGRSGTGSSTGQPAPPTRAWRWPRRRR